MHFSEKKKKKKDWNFYRWSSRDASDAPNYCAKLARRSNQQDTVESPAFLKLRFAEYMTTQLQNSVLQLRRIWPEFIPRKRQSAT